MAPGKDDTSSAQPARRPWTYRDLVALAEARSVTVLRRPRANAGLTDVTVLTLAKGETLE
jgi:hypothetical protein